MLSLGRSRRRGLMPPAGQPPCFPLRQSSLYGLVFHRPCPQCVAVLGWLAGLCPKRFARLFVSSEQQPTDEATFEKTFIKKSTKWLVWEKLFEVWRWKGTKDMCVSGNAWDIYKTKTCRERREQAHDVEPCKLWHADAASGRRLCAASSATHRHTHTQRPLTSKQEHVLILLASPTPTSSNSPST